MVGPIRIECLDFGYPGVPLFERFHFTSSATRTLIRGPSGCGKTTLLRILCGVQPVPPKTKVETPTPPFVVLQSDGLVPWMTGQENFELFSKDLWDNAVRSPLFPLIEPFSDRRACDLSFGQRRSLELTRALLSKRPLLLLDEPLNFLDRNRRAVFLEFMADEAVCGSHIVMTSHYEDGAALPGSCVVEFSGDPPFRELQVTK